MAGMGKSSRGCSLTLDQPASVGRQREEPTLEGLKPLLANSVHERLARRSTALRVIGEAGRIEGVNAPVRRRCIWIMFIDNAFGKRIEFLTE